MSTVLEVGESARKKYGYTGDTGIQADTTNRADRPLRGDEVESEELKCENTGLNLYAERSEALNPKPCRCLWGAKVSVVQPLGCRCFGINMVGFMFSGCMLGSPAGIRGKV